MAAFIFKGVEIDVCPECFGVWLDAGELEKVSALAGSPGNTDRPVRKSSSDSLEDTLDVADIASDIDAGVLDGVVDFVTDAVGALFDGVSL